MSDRKKRVPETPESKLARQLRLGIIPKVLRAAPVVTPPAEKTYKRSFEFRAETEVDVREVVAAIGRKFNLSDEKIQQVIPTQGNLPNQFSPNTQEYWKFSAALKPIVSAESPKAIRHRLRAEFNAAVSGKLPARLRDPYFHENSGAVFTVTEVLPKVETEVLPKVETVVSKTKSKQPESSKKTKPVAKKHSVQMPSAEELWDRDAAAIARELIPLFSQKKLPSDRVVRCSLKKREIPLSAEDEIQLIFSGTEAPYQFELVIRGGDKEQHQQYNTKITNPKHFLNTRNGEMCWIDAPGARAAAKRAAPKPEAPRSKLVKLLHAYRAAPSEPPQIPESRFTLDRPFAELLVQHLGSYYEIRDGRKPSDFCVGSEKTPENDQRAVKREFWEAIGEPIDKKKMAGRVLRKIAKLGDSDQQLLIALVREVSFEPIGTETKIMLLKRGVAHLELLRDEGIPREVFMLEEADFLAEAKKHHTPPEPKTPITTVGSVEHQNPPVRGKTR